MEPPAIFHFRGLLMQLLRQPSPDGVVAYPVTRQTSIKDVIEALGPPHTEVYGLLVGGKPVDFGHRLGAGEQVTVLPADGPIDVTVATLLRPAALTETRFLVDANAGKLATWLRLLGFDTAYDQTLEDAALAEKAAAEGRIVLSRDHACLKRSKIVYGRLVVENDPRAQLDAVLAAFGLKPPYATFTRCLRCNAVLVPVAKKDVLPQLLPKTRQYFDDFHQCPVCRRVYWPGSHHDHMRAWIQTLAEPDQGTT